MSINADQKILSKKLNTIAGVVDQSGLSILVHFGVELLNALKKLPAIEVLLQLYVKANFCQLVAEKNGVVDRGLYWSDVKVGRISYDQCEPAIFPDSHLRRWRARTAVQMRDSHDRIRSWESACFSSQPPRHL